MTYKQLQDEVIALRFNESKRASIKSWLNLRYAWVWDQAEWVFKRVPPTALAVANGSRTPAMPTDLADVEQVFDDQGATLEELDPDSWDSAFQWDSSSGRPGYYTTVNRQLYLGPTPNAAYSFKLSYRRRLSHVDSITGITGGIMVEDTDQPIWSAEYDYLLVLEAAMLGMQLEKDDGWAQLKPQRDELLAAMIEDLTDGADTPVVQWGRAWC